MTMLLGSVAGRFSRSHCCILVLRLLLLLHVVILGQYGPSTTVAASRIHVREIELQRSLSRYRQLLQHDNSRPDTVKPEELAVSSEPESKTVGGTIGDIAVENLKKDEDVFQAVQGIGLEVQQNKNAEVKENDNLNQKLIEEQKGDQATNVDDPNKDNDGQKRQKKKGRKNKQSKQQRQDRTKELKLTAKDGIEQQKGDDVKIEEQYIEGLKEENVSTIEKETERNAETQLQQDQKRVEPELEAENQQTESEAVQGVRLEVEQHNKAEVKQNDNLNQEVIEEQKGDQAANVDDPTNGNNQKRVEPELEAENQQTEKEVQTKTEENAAEERKDPNFDAHDEKTDGWKESDSKSDEQKTEDWEEKSESKIEEAKSTEPFVFPEPYLLGPPINDWDEQRGNWLDANPHMKTTSDGKPRVLIITGSQPWPCRNPVGDNFNLRAFKLKMDYARMHNYEIYYNFAFLDPLFGSYWVKLPILRKLMISHPEIEWFFWVDSDALFTDMIFEAPFHTYEGHNMIMWAYKHGFYVEKSWLAFNAGVFMIRNCQWSLDLIDKWSPMGPEGPVRDEYGKILTGFLSYREENYPSDDQSALAYLILTDEAVKSKVKMIDLDEYMVSAWYLEVVDNYETSMEKYHPGLGDFRWPWITHFTGCGPCNADGTNPNHEKCMKSIERALNFADNQVMAYMGFQHDSLNSSHPLIRTRNETDRPLEFVGVNPWQERIAQVAAGSAG